ncbi:HPr family phosphocarrier protein [Paenibacillus sp. SYP-B4298]|uniref:HPr family phosphocarrier protein n=1 Tax=Paenibacillus sp. SYP-B4298 TaxID=2996034 RepID=UPI0022DE9667|nr:HPr family phosphocarrier protein [Paenibacillus sp. SYP-B4298]
MISQDTVIRNDSGFHIRPAQLFTEKATGFNSTVSIIVKGTDIDVDGKSILGLMTLGLSKGSEITIRTDGPDEQEALTALVALVESGFGEA